MSVRRAIALSDHPAARVVRSAYHSIRNFSLSAPAFITRPVVAAFLAIRGLYYFLLRVLICEPFFKAHCATYGRGVRTGVFLHWITGSGRIIVGDNVLVDGKCSIMFAVRYAENPTLSIGSNSILSHGCSLTIGRQITIGNHCLIAAGARIFDSPGHPTDPVLRKAGNPANPQDVRPVTIEDNVWIGTEAVIFPGVTVGEGSVVAVRSVVTHDVPPFTIVAGNPAREIGRLTNADEARRPESEKKLPHDAHRVADISPAGEPATNTLEAVTEVVSQFIGISQLEPGQDFYDAGVTSIMTLPLLMELEERFQVSIPQDRFLDARTVTELAAEIEQLIVERTRSTG